MEMIDDIISKFVYLVFSEYDVIWWVVFGVIFVKDSGSMFRNGWRKCFFSFGEGSLVFYYLKNWCIDKEYINFVFDICYYKCGSLIVCFCERRYNCYLLRNWSCSIRWSDWKLKW